LADSGIASIERTRPAQIANRDRVWKVVTRFVVATGLAATVCELVWLHLSNRLSVTTDIAGNPTFANFDGYRYQYAFELAAWMFPALAVLVYVLLSWRGPLRRSRRAARVRPIPVDVASETSGRVTVDSPQVRMDWRDGFWMLVRLALPGAVAALEVSAATGSSTVSSVGVLSGLAYVFFVLVAAEILAALRPHWRRIEHGPWSSRFETCTSVINSFCGPVMVLSLLYFVSWATIVTIANPHRVVHYPWMPLWLVVVLVVLTVTWCARTHWGASAWRSSKLVEGSVLATVVGCTAVFLTTMSLPSALGTFIGFDDAQFLAGAQLVFVHGLLPWRDIYLLHGLLEDVFSGAIGMGVFSHSRWGAVAGQTMILYPLQCCIYYLFAVYFARRNRLVPLIVAILVVGGYLPPLLARFVLLPVVLILFDKMIRARSRFWCFAFSLNLVIQAIVTPEIGLLAVGVAATLVAFEWLGRSRGESIPTSFYRTLWCGGFALGLALCFAIYLWMTASLGAFVGYYQINIGSHLLWGALPITWFNIADIRDVVYFYLPILLLLLTVWRAVGKLRNQRPWSSREWTLIAAGTFVVLYTQKTLDRADVVHVVEVFTVFVPFVILWGIDAITTVDRCIREALSRGAASLRRVMGTSTSALGRALSSIGQTPRIASVLVAIVLPLVTPAVLASIRSSPGATHASSPAEPTIGLLGYTLPGTVDTTQVQDLGKFLDAYVPGNSPVFDFANEPGVLYFLLNRVPGARFLTIETAQTTQAQQMAISQLKQSRPRLVVFSDETFGLGADGYDFIDGMIRNYQVSEYLLQHYVPFADVDGQLVLLRRDLVGKVRPPGSVGVPVVTSGLYFEQPSCDWGYIPNFLQVPAEVGRSRGVSLKVVAAKPRSETIAGWAIDDQSLEPSAEVMAVIAGRVVATATPDMLSPDLATAFQTTALTYSRFLLNVPRALIRQGLEIYSLNSNGTVTRILSSGAEPAASVIDRGVTPRFVIDRNGVRRAVEASARTTGFVDRISPVYIYEMKLPAAVDRSNYSWLRLGFSRVSGQTNIELGDDTEVPTRQITLSTLAGTGRTIDVNVGACSQWYGYQTGTLRVVDSSSDPIVSARLIR